MVFDFFKSNSKKVEEKIKHNRKIYSYDFRTFCYNLSSYNLMDYTINTIRLLYSFQGLKDYYTPFAKDTDVKLECLFIIASIVERNLPDLEREYYEVNDMIELLLREASGGLYIMPYHIIAAVKIIRNKYDFKEYNEKSFNGSLKYFFDSINSISSQNDWNVNIDKISLQYLTNFDSLLQEASNKIKDANFIWEKSHRRYVYELFNQFESMVTVQYEDRITKTIRKELEYQPDLFVYGMTRDMADKVDNYLLKRLNIDIKDFDLQYYKENRLFYTADHKNAYLNAFQRSVMDGINGSTEKAIFKLNNMEITIPKDDIFQMIDDSITNYC